jgi:hypothetical protein
MALVRDVGLEGCWGVTWGSEMVGEGGVLGLILEVELMGSVMIKIWGEKWNGLRGV